MLQFFMRFSAHDTVRLNLMIFYRLGLIAGNLYKDVRIEQAERESQHTKYSHLRLSIQFTCNKN